MSAENSQRTSPVIKPALPMELPDPRPRSVSGRSTLSSPKLGPELGTEQNTKVPARSNSDKGYRNGKFHLFGVEGFSRSSVTKFEY